MGAGISKRRECAHGAEVSQRLMCLLCIHRWLYRTRAQLHSYYSKKGWKCYGRTARINVDAEHKTLEHGSLRIISIYTVVVSFILLKRQVDQYNIAASFPLSFFYYVQLNKKRGKRSRCFTGNENLFQDPLFTFLYTSVPYDAQCICCISIYIYTIRASFPHRYTLI